MPIAYNARTVPLAPSGSNPLAASLTLAYDFTGHDTRPLWQAYKYLGATAPTLAPGTWDALTHAGLPGRAQSASGVIAWYQSAIDYGLQFGTGDFTIVTCATTPASLPATIGGQALTRLDNNSSDASHDAGVNSATTGWDFGSNYAVGTAQSVAKAGVNTTMLFFFRRQAGVTSGWFMRVGVDSAPQRRYADRSDATAARAWDSTYLRRVYLGGSVTGDLSARVSLHFVRAHNVAFSEAQMTSYANDIWAIDEHPPPDTTLPVLTGTLTATPTGYTTATLSWPTGSDNVAVTSYEVQLDAGAWTDVGNVTTVDLTSLTQSTNYTARVRAKDAAGNVSTPALEASFTTGGPPPGDPTSVVATTVDESTADVTWAAGSPAGATYEVQLETPSGAGNWATPAGTLSGLSFEATGLSPATGYRARVRAATAGQFSAWVVSNDFTTDNIGTGGGTLPTTYSITSPAGGFAPNTGSGARAAGTAFNWWAFAAKQIGESLSGATIQTGSGTLNGSGQAVLSGLTLSGSWECQVRFADGGAARWTGTAA